MTNIRSQSDCMLLGIIYESSILMVPPTYHAYTCVHNSQTFGLLSKDQRCKGMMTFIRILHMKILICTCNACGSHPNYRLQIPSC